MRLITRSALGLAVVAGLLSACSSGSDSGSTGGAASTATTAPAASGKTINVSLKEFTVKPSAASASAGSVTFAVKNEGTVDHEFVVVKSDLAADKLPMKDGALVDETKIEVVGEIEQFAAGASQSKTFDLKAGKYLLICNLPAHYGAGMTTAFTVN